MFLFVYTVIEFTRLFSIRVFLTKVANRLLFYINRDMMKSNRLKEILFLYYFFRSKDTVQIVKTAFQHDKANKLRSIYRNFARRKRDKKINVCQRCKVEYNFDPNSVCSYSVSLEIVSIISF